MNLKIHMLHPVQSHGKWEVMRCGLNRNKELDDYRTTTNPEEVTCIKCQGFINNPWRSLRQYGKLVIIENEAIALYHDWGWNVDIIAVNEHNGAWTVVIGGKNFDTIHTSKQADSIAELGKNLLEFYETNLIKIQRS